MNAKLRIQNGRKVKKINILGNLLSFLRAIFLTLHSKFSSPSFCILNSKFRILLVLLFSTQFFYCPTVNYNNPTDGANGVLMQLLDTLLATFAGANTNSPELKAVLTGNPSAITEGQTATVQIKLSKAITSNLTVTLSLDNPIMTIDTAATKEFTFTPDNATVEQSFTLAALTDANSISETVNLKITAAGLTDQSFSISTIDNTVEIVQTVIFTGLPSTITEGQTSIVQVKLAKEVTSAVTVVLILDNSAITVDGSSFKILNFPSGSGTADQTILLSAVSDTNSISETVNMKVSTTGVTDKTFSISTIDNTVEVVQALEFTGMPATITEGQSATVQVKLAKEVTSTVTLVLTLDNSAITIDGSSFKIITFGVGSGTVNQSFTLAAIADTNSISETVNLKSSATGLTDRTFSISTIDNTVEIVQAVEFTGLPATITEGQTATVQVKLTKEVASTVTVVLTLDNSAITIDGSSFKILTFGVGSGTVNQSFTLAAIADTNSISETVNLKSSATGMTDRTFSISTIDNTVETVQAVVFTGLPATMTEGQTATVQVKLAKEVTSTVIVSLTMDNSAITIDGISSKALTFVVGSGTSNQSFTLAAVKDSNLVSETVTMAVTATGLISQTYSVSTIDNTAPAPIITVSNAPTSIVEGQTGTVGIKLSGAVTENFIVTVTSGYALAFTVSPSILIFTPANFSVDQIVTISALQDANVVSESVVFSLTAPGLNSVNFTVSTADDDTINITLTSGITTLSEGGSGSISVSLTKQPSSNVTVNVSSNNTNALTLALNDLIFTPANYNVPQSVTINAVQDVNQTSETVVISAISSELTTTTLNIICVDDDTTIVFGTPTGYEGGSLTVPITLSGNPGMARIVNFSSNNNPPTFSPSSINFTTGNYNTPQTLTLTGLTDSNTTTIITASGTGLITNIWNASNVKYSIGGTVSGMTGSIVLQNYSGNDLTLSANGSFSFSTLRSVYNVTVKTYPTRQVCTVSNGVGNATANVTNINVICSNLLGSSALGLIRTGQTTVYAAGDDGSFQKTLPRTFTDNGDGTVTDNLTSLIWQKCSRGQDVTTCSNSASTADFSTAGSYCTGINLASKSWRLPRIEELLTIIDYTKTSGAFIDTLIFPSTEPQIYWSSNTGQGGFYPTFPALVVNFANAQSSAQDKGFSGNVRCVSGTSPSVSSYTNNGDGTLTDNTTKLVWQKCSIGYNNDLSCSDDGNIANTRNWTDALSACNSLTLAGMSWRLPNINELQSLVKYTTSQPSIDTDSFPNTLSSSYWSSSTDATTTNAWATTFMNGTDNKTSKSANSYARCVSGP